MERKTTGCVLGRKEMIIVVVIALLVVAGIGCIICASIPKNPCEDEEQEAYLKEWREKHRNFKRKR